MAKKSGLGRGLNALLNDSGSDSLVIERKKNNCGWEYSR
jgi:hypothetical protein